MADTVQSSFANIFSGSNSSNNSASNIVSESTATAKSYLSSFSSLISSGKTDATSSSSSSTKEATVSNTNDTFLGRVSNSFVKSVSTAATDVGKLATDAYNNSFKNDVNTLVKSSLAAQTTATRTPKDLAPTELPYVIGLPPTLANQEFFRYSSTSGSSGNFYNDMLLDSAPLLEIEPCERQSSNNLGLFRLVNSWSKKIDQNKRTYIEELKDFYNVTAPSNSNSLKLCYMPESPIQETFNTDYGNSAFANLAEGAKNGFVSDMAQIFNIRSLEDSANKITGGISGLKNGKQIGAMIGKGISDVKSAMGNSEFGKALGDVVNVAFTSAIGHGIDFPELWKDSSYTPTYSFSVRLYNPFPQSDESTNRYIVAPLAAILSFVVPRTDNGDTYYYPWCCRFGVRGLLPMTPGYVKSVSVIKGGDHNVVTMNQRVGMVDIKIDFASLHHVMLGGNHEKKNSDSPQLYHYLREFVNKRTYSSNGELPAWNDDSYGNGSASLSGSGSNVLASALGKNMSKYLPAAEKLATNGRTPISRLGSLYDQVSEVKSSASGGVNFSNASELLTKLKTN